MMGRGELAAVAAATTWAFGSIVFGALGKRASAFALNLAKCFFAGSLLLVTSFLLSGSLLPRGATSQSLWLLALSGICGLTLGDTAYFNAMSALGVPRAILVQSSAPIFAAMGGFLFMDERLDRRALIGMGLAIAGIALVVGRRDPDVGRRKQLGRGLVYGLLGALGQASGSLLSRRAMQVGLDPLGAAAGRTLVGGFGILAIALVTGNAREWGASLTRDRIWAKIAIASLVGTYVGIWLAQYALARSSSTGVATTLLATSPVFALPMAHFTGGERMTRVAALGVLVAMAGIAVLSLR